MWRDISPSGWGLPPPTTGFRLEAASVLAFPASDLGNFSSISFSPDIRVGYEVMLGNFGIEGGGMARFTDWRLDGDTGDTLWTMETMAYGRVALHLSRFALHALRSVSTPTTSTARCWTCRRPRWVRDERAIEHRHRGDPEARVQIRLRLPPGHRQN
jgi:hypothetical protein